jgi:hypothetical protein
VSRTIVAAFVAAVLATACKPSGPAPEASALYAQKNTPANLKGLIAAIFEAAEKGEHQKAAVLIRSLIVDEAAAKLAMRDDAPVDYVASYTASARQNLKETDEKLLSLFKRGDPKRTQINVHAATTEELIANAPDSIGFAEFPKGAHRLAAVVLRPKTTFYEVELVKPGDDGGLKYHLFFWDGTRWRMFGPAWRNLPGSGADD